MKRRSLVSPKTHPNWRRAPPASSLTRRRAWKIIADLFGGVFVGLGIGWGIDHFAGTTPVGIIGGVLLGFAVSVWMAWRTAQRLMAEAKQHGEPQSVPFDDDEDQGA